MNPAPVKIQPLPPLSAPSATLDPGSVWVVSIAGSLFFTLKDSSGITFFSCPILVAVSEKLRSCVVLRTDKKYEHKKIIIIEAGP